MSRQARRVKTPIFDALASRYSTRNGWPDDSAEQWALGAYMRGFTYGLVLQDVVRPPMPPEPRPWASFTEAWHATHPSPWDAIDATPNEHDPNL